MAAAIFAIVLSGGVARADITGPAIVRADSSLVVAGRIVRLFGIHIPPTERTCVSPLFPVRCKERVARALELKIERFVRCEAKSVNPDRSINAVCWEGVTPVSEPEDLGAWLLAQGWAVALPDAPFEYHVLERIAYARGLGVWGFQVDSIR